MGTFDALNEKMKAQLKELLDQFDLTTQVKTSSSAVSYAAYLYKSCLKLGAESSEEGLRQLKEVVESILGKWGIGQLQRTKEFWPWQEFFLRAYTRGSMSPIFSIGIGPDSKNVTKNIISVSVCKFKVILYILIL